MSTNIITAQKDVQRLINEGRLKPTFDYSGNGINGLNYNHSICKELISDLGINSTGRSYVSTKFSSVKENNIWTKSNRKSIENGSGSYLPIASLNSRDVQDVTFNINNPMMRVQSYSEDRQKVTTNDTIVQYNLSSEYKNYVYDPPLSGNAAYKITNTDSNYIIPIDFKTYTVFNLICTLRIDEGSECSFNMSITNPEKSIQFRFNSKNNGFNITSDVGNYKIDGANSYFHRIIFSIERETNSDGNYDYTLFIYYDNNSTPIAESVLLFENTNQSPEEFDLSVLTGSLYVSSIKSVNSYQPLLPQINNENDLNDSIFANFRAEYSVNNYDNSEDSIIHGIVVTSNSGIGNISNFYQINTNSLSTLSLGRLEYDYSVAESVFNRYTKQSDSNLVLYDYNINEKIGVVNGEDVYLYDILTLEDEDGKPIENPNLTMSYSNNTYKITANITQDNKFNIGMIEANFNSSNSSYNFRDGLGNMYKIISIILYDKSSNVLSTLQQSVLTNIPPSYNTPSILNEYNNVSFYDERILLFSELGDYHAPISYSPDGSNNFITKIELFKTLEDKIDVTEFETKVEDNILQLVINGNELSSNDVKSLYGMSIILNDGTEAFSVIFNEQDIGSTSSSDLVIALDLFGNGGVFIE